MPAQKEKWIIGIDEAGRGPLAGPVAVGIVRVATSNKKKVYQIFQEVKDSKKLSPKERDFWYQKLLKERKNGNLDFTVCLSSHTLIDKKGIVGAIKNALNRGLVKIGKGIEKKDMHILLDGSLFAPADYPHQKTIIRGDQTEWIISLASIAAKVVRDRKMLTLSKQYRNYAFDTHKGYGTPKHRTLILKFGLCDIHRRSYCKALTRTKE